MASSSGFSRFLKWLASPSVFGSPKKRFSGKWALYEYYVDGPDDLYHFDEVELKTKGESIIIEFSEEGDFTTTVKMPLSLLKNLKSGRWAVSRNYITLCDPSEFRNNLEFQFAFEKGTLKFLKKDLSGRIEFFGFFKKREAKK